MIAEDIAFLKEKVIEIDEKLHELRQQIEDSKLTPEERIEMEKSLAKIRAVDTSDFVSLEKVKKGLGL